MSAGRVGGGMSGGMGRRWLAVGASLGDAARRFRAPELVWTDPEEEEWSAALRVWRATLE